MDKESVYGYGDLGRFERIEYFPLPGGEVGKHKENKIALFIKYYCTETFDACEIYTLEDEKFITVSKTELTLMSKNEK